MSSEFEGDLLDWALFRLDHIEGDKQNEVRTEDDPSIQLSIANYAEPGSHGVMSWLSRQRTGYFVAVWLAHAPFFLKLPGFGEMIRTLPFSSGHYRYPVHVIADTQAYIQISPGIYCL